MEAEKLPCMEEAEVDYNLIDCEVLKAIREQRHDFMNHIQVIWGYLQLKKPEQAVRYITEINEEYSVFGSLFKLGNPSLSLFLYKYIKRAYKQGISVDFEGEINSLNSMLESVGHNEINKLGELFEDILVRTANQEEKVIYIDLFDEEGVLYIVVSNNSPDDCEESFDRDDMDNSGYHMKQTALELGEQGINIYSKENGDKITLKIGFY